MVQPRTVGVILICGGWRSLTVNEIEWIAGERIGSVEDAAGPLCGLTSLDTINVISPGLISIERLWLGDVES